jgi:hypothetical protein
LTLGEQLLGELAPGKTDPSLFERHLAFRWDSSRAPGHLAPIEEPAPFDLDDLIGVDDSLAALERNTQQLLGRHPYNNVLLHGERGTGKSSAVRGLLSRYADRGLRVVEVERADLVHLSHVLDALRAGDGWSFLIFCDDLSFGLGEAGYRELKAALDGSLTALPQGVCIVATSNRRSLVPQTMAENRAARVDEEGELHLGEALEEKLALADRFGLVLGFYSFDQTTYLEIVSHYLAQAGIDLLDDELRRESLRWALTRANRSGRTARQFVDDVVGRRRLEQS